MDAKRKQVASQCRAIVHMAKAIAEIYEDYGRRYAVASPADKLLDVVGRRSAAHMESLGDILNSMDAVVEQDAWLDPIFDEAHRLWPQQETAP